MSRRVRFRVLVLSSLLLVLAFGLTCGGGDGGGGGGSGFRVVGRLANPKGKAASPVTADYVYAVNTYPRAGGEWRKKVPVEADGSFTIDLHKGDPWVLAFIDSSRVGDDMIQGIFRAEQLDSVVPKTYDSDDSTDVGDVVVDESGSADIDPQQYETFVGDLGMDLTEAATLGSLDDLMLRYINPDIDGNGILDMDDPDMPGLNICFMHDYMYGDSALLTYIQNGVELPRDATVTLSHSGPELRIWPKAESGIYSAAPPKWSLEWTNAGDYGGTNPAVRLASSPDPTVCTYDDPDSIGTRVFFPSTVTDVPDGTYIYRLYSSEVDSTPAVTLTFTHVKTMDDASDTTNFVFPFPVFNMDGNGDVTSVSYTWMRKEVAGFVPATSDDVEMVLGRSGAQIMWCTAPYLTATAEETGTVEWFPQMEGFATTGTISLSDAMWIGAALSPKRADIAVLSITFFSKLGRWIWLNIR